MKTKSMKSYLLLWSTQSLSGLGSAMTGYALVLWLYQKTGSALETALLSVCSYAPYVLMSIFAGALSDRWDKRKTMLVCDLLAALCTTAVLVLLRLDLLAPWHMYALNAITGLMNTVQQPAADVAASLLIPPEEYQRTSGLRSFSGSLTTILTPVFASMLYAFSGVTLVVVVDLVTFAVAFTTLLCFIRIPEAPSASKAPEPLLTAARSGLRWLKTHRLILTLIVFLAFVNLVASAFDAALPALILPRENGGETVLGLVNGLAGVATLLGSVLVTVTPAPKNRVRAICLALLFSLGTENFLLALGHAPIYWYVGSLLGWVTIPILNANMDVIFRTTIPVEMQGRVFSCRNTLQFFTIPLGFFLGGLLVDEVFEPLMAAVSPDGLLSRLLGTGKGSGAAMLLLLLGFAGVTVCLVFSLILRRMRE